VRVSGEEVSVGPFVSESDEAERFREREETKRLMYVALTRARDRLYLGTVLKDGVFATGRGSLADVLPESFRTLCVCAAQQPGDSVEWTGPAGRAYQFRICRALPVPDRIPVTSTSASAEALAKRVRRQETPTDFFAPLTDPAAIERVPVTAALAPAPESSVGTPSPVDAEDDALVGTLVHRLFQVAAELPAPFGAADATALATRLIRPEERATAADAPAAVTRAIEVWMAMRAQPGVNALLESGERIHELPFSCLADHQPGRVLRGTIDCLVRRPDGSIVVIEFKTGAPSPRHEAQLDLYVRAARGMFPDAAVTGRLIYPR
jgi:ATP-dependent helicase/nuclease subunit A